jgi:glycine/D-amino acid oxidase-like deaminating enzyme
VAVVGGGIVAWSCAWLLLQWGHPVVLIAPSVERPSGSWAALGVLMGQVFHRSSGRAWRLRRQSLTLWNQWCQALAGRGRPVARRAGLLLLAAEPKEVERLQRLASERQRQGLPLHWWGPERLATLSPALPTGALGGLHSASDGQIDPRQALAALAADAQAAGLVARDGRVEAIERRGEHWRLALAGGDRLEAAAVVLAAGLGSAALLGPLGHGLALEPVLGQAAALTLEAAPAWNWPGAVVWRGVNLVPRPDLAGGHRLWLGATLEPGRTASAGALADLRELGGAAPDWLRAAVTIESWHGLRCRPVGQPAPVLEELEPGLLLACGHHRNGVLLAPATASWVVDRVAAMKKPP